VSTGSSDEDTVFNREYESSILAVLSGQFVSFPETREPIDGTSQIILHHDFIQFLYTENILIITL
jgi:hypothetical protein